jgi:hypothetical protein
MTCEHAEIVTYLFADTRKTSGLWACKACKKKFAPLDLEQEKDAARYRWLKAQNNLSLRSEGSQWTRQDGTKFISTHTLCAGDTQFGPAESLDENIDVARAMDWISAGKHLETQAKS